LFCVLSGKLYVFGLPMDDGSALCVFPRIPHSSSVLLTMSRDWWSHGDGMEPHDVNLYTNMTRLGGPGHSWVSPRRGGSTASFSGVSMEEATSLEHSWPVLCVFGSSSVVMSVSANPLSAHCEVPRGLPGFAPVEVLLGASDWSSVSSGGSQEYVEDASVEWLYPRLFVPMTEGVIMMKGEHFAGGGVSLAARLGSRPLSHVSVISSRVGRISVSDVTALDEPAPMLELAVSGMATDWLGNEDMRLREVLPLGECSASPSWVMQGAGESIVVTGDALNRPDWEDL